MGIYPIAGSFRHRIVDPATTALDAVFAQARWIDLRLVYYRTTIIAGSGTNFYSTVNIFLCHGMFLRFYDTPCGGVIPVEDNCC